MAIVYQNVDFNSYSAEPPENAIGQEYILEFSTDKSAIPAVVPEYWTQNEYIYAVMDGAVAGISLINIDNNAIFANTSDIVLPAEVGESVSGTLEDITNELRAIVVPK